MSDYNFGSTIALGQPPHRMQLKVIYRFIVFLLCELVLGLH